MQNLNIVLDISSIIWDENDYNANEQEYYGLVDGVTNFLSKIELENTKVLLSTTLQLEMMANFPFGKPTYYDSTFEKQTLSFLSRVETVEFPASISPNPNSYPELIKEYYNGTTKNEIGLLVSKLHSDDQTKSKYFTFNYLWGGNDKLKTETDDKTNTYETIIADNGNDLEDFFNKYKLVFEHKSPKHDCSIHKNRNAWNKWSKDDGDFVSQLSSYCEKKKDVVQEILNKRYYKCFGNELYYGYDKVNNVYVAFRITLNNEFHAYDMYDIESVPNEVKKAFNIWK